MAETPVEETPVEVRPVKEPLIEEPKKKETPEKPDKKPFNKKAVILAALLLLLLIGIGTGVYFAFFREDPDDGRIPYAEGVVLLGGDEIEPVEEGWINLRYNKKAFSSDGVHFTGLLANDAGNVYDMYFDVYADANFEDQVYLSGLLKPGYGLTEFQLSHGLPSGTTNCYVVFNQVDEDEDGNQFIVRQMLVTVGFVVE